MTRTVPTVRRFLETHTLAAYFGLTFILSWGAILAIVGPGGLPIAADQVQAVGAAAMLGPALAALLVLGIGRGAGGLRELGSRLLALRAPPRWYAVALLLAPVSTAATLLLLSAGDGDVRPPILTTTDTAPLLLAGLAAGLMIGLFEELGWTGIAVPRLRRRFGPLATGITVGLVWGVWHFILFWEGDSFAAALPFALLLARLFSWLPAYRVLMVWVHDHTESLGIVVLMHASLVATTVILEPPLEGGSLLTYILVRAALLWGVVAWVALARRPAAETRGS